MNDQQKELNSKLTNQLYNLALTYKGFSGNRFTNFLTTKTFKDENMNDLVVEECRALKDEQGMYFCVWFEGADTFERYDFHSSRVLSWMQEYFDKCLVRMEWK